MSPLLQISNVTKYFGGLAALNNLSFDVNAGEIVGLIGPNGAGKSTLFNVITGFYTPTNGHVIYKGEDISKLKAHQIAERGLVRTFQLTVLFSEFSVLQNVVLGSHLKSNVLKGLFSRQGIPDSEIKRANDILELVELSHLKDYKAKDLPHGYQRILAVAIALGANPEMLLLDEPVTGMNLAEIEKMTALIRSLRSERNVTMVVVEHNVKTVMDLCERIVVINFGQKIAEGSPDEVRRNEGVCEAYLGKEAA